MMTIDALWTQGHRRTAECPGLVAGIAPAHSDLRELLQVLEPPGAARRMVVPWCPMVSLVPNHQKPQETLTK